MAQATVWFVVDYAVRAPHVAEFERLAKAMCEKTAEEPGTLVYKWHVSRDRATARLVESYVDGKAVLAHITGPVIRDLVPRMDMIAEVTGFEVYGEPGPEAAAVLAELGAAVYAPLAGFSR